MTHQPVQNQFLHGIVLPYGSASSADVQKMRSKFYISRIELIKTYYGINFANHSGYQLNVELTINWAQMGFTTWPEIDKAFRSFIECMHKHIKSYRNRTDSDMPFFQYTVFENGLLIGPHSHSGIHVPREIFPLFHEWLTKRLRDLNKTGIENVWYCASPRSDPTTSQWKWFSYSMKGLDPSLTAEETLRDYYRPGLTANYLFGVNQEYGGFVPFRRVRRSHAMSERQQANAGYVESVFHSDGTSNARYSDKEYQRGRQDRLMAETTRMLSRIEII